MDELHRPMTVRLTFEKLRRLRTILDARKDRIEGAEENFENEALKDGAQDVDFTVAEAEVGEVQEIEDALARMQSETYGVCENCGREIPFERLEVLPYTRHCADCERKLERRKF